MAFRFSPSLARMARHVLAAGALLAAGLASADDGKPIRVLVGFPAGGGTDVVARLLSDKLKDELGTAVVVDNRPGAGGQVAALALKSAPADGSVFFLTNDHTVSIVPLVMKNPGFNTARDFAPVVGFASYASVLVLSAGTPAKDFKEYVAWVRKEGGKSSVGIPAPASLPEFITTSIGKKNNLDLVAAPYRGSAPMLADMMGNQIPAGISAINDFVESHKAGKIRMVAASGKTRPSLFPDVPTFGELGMVGFENSPFYAVYAPAGTPSAVIDRFSAAMKKVLEMPAVRERMTALGLTIEYLNAPQLAAREKTYSEAWGTLIKASGYVPQ
ncbi:Bug family tripartite tricarboxylate transporter substrate binding protein [Variovorax sp. J22R133]|uniref:Bug family tripartite tricarboxylate transporter substrate binding protein n=1 Tax=Variovorax brevis TaxID=3053503 RepID=UPI0025790B3B|nr:Bug family tripartite tricarboxylate transporter substrate binding protein [Variovorax sp. J22R133]MDM0116932.1 Bug family tripartite tricarboxylate transporter substrate binding protein [Variovorax sp. J22R133]